MASDPTVRPRKKLIEVALPLNAINAASSREKSIRHGHPSTLHLWWARRPLAAARAVIFAQMVDDPAEYTDDLLSDPVKKRQARAALKKRQTHTEGTEAHPRSGNGALADMAAQLERERLFKIIENLVKWENTTNETVLEDARNEIWQSWRRTCAENADHPRAAELFDRSKLPAFHDPFAGGGTLPLEAQRLGLEAHASDLNPVAVLINKAMIEIPPKFAGRPTGEPGLQESRGRGYAAGPPAERSARAGDDRQRALAGRTGAGGGCAVLRSLDAGGGRETHRRHLYPKVEDHAGDGARTAGPRSSTRAGS